MLPVQQKSAEPQVLCRSGGIGRRAWFRSTYSQGCGGSSPFFGTNLLESAAYNLTFPFAFLPSFNGTRRLTSAPARSLAPQPGNASIETKSNRIHIYGYSCVENNRPAAIGRSSSFDG